MSVSKCFPSSDVSVNSSLHLLKVLLLASFSVLQGLVSSWSLFQITSLTCLCCLFQILLCTKKMGKKNPKQNKALASVANFPFSVKITLVALSNFVSFSQGSSTEIIQCLFLYKFSKCCNVLETSWDVSSFFTG